MKIVQVANFVTSSSGGLRTTLNHLAEEYAEQGHEVVQVLPGPEDAQLETPWGRQVVLHAPLVPGLGYRLDREVSVSGGANANAHANAGVKQA